MRLARKLTFLLLSAIVVVFLVDASLNTRLYQQLYFQDLKRDHHVLSRALSLGVVAAWRDHGEDYALRFVREANEREAPVRIRWVRLDAGPGDPRAPQADPDAVARALRESHYYEVELETDGEPRFYSYAPLTLEGRPATALELSDSLADSEGFLVSRSRVKLASVAAMVAVCGLLAWFAGLRLVGRPTRLLVEKAHRVGAGDFSAPLELRTRDELADLAVAMNAMASQLDDARQRVASESAARLEALEQLRHADRLTTIGKLAAGLAHELGTPLNVVAGRAKMIAAGELSGEGETRDSARIIAEQAARMTAIVRQLLDFARRRSGNKRSTDLAQLLKDTGALLAPLADRHRVRLELEAPAGPLMAHVDPDQIHQALANLVVNAIQASPAGGAVVITASRGFERPPLGEGGRPGPHVRIAVQDRGEGIPAERLPLIFDPFYTTKDVGKGTGLGLCVSSGIVREHGGWLEVESEPGRGSRFSVLLPSEGGVG